MTTDTTTTEREKNRPPASHCDHAKAPAGARFCGHCGAALPRHRMVVWWHACRAAISAVPLRKRVIAATVATVLTAGIGGLYWVQDTWYAPTEPVKQLVEAMKTGDGPALIAAMKDADLDDVDIKAAEESPLLADGALDDGYEAPEDIKIGAPEYGIATDTTQRENRDVATIPLSYQLDGERYRHDVTVTRDDHGWFRPWQLSAADLVVPVAVDAAHTRHHRVTVASVETVWSSPAVALPGVYDVTADGDELFDTASKTVTIGIGGHGQNGSNDQIHVDFDAPATDDAIEEVESQIREFIDDCADNGPPDVSCNFDDDSGAAQLVPKNAEWDVESYPDIELEMLSDDDDDTGPVAVRTTTPGTAKSEYENVVDQSRSADVEISAYGHVTVDADGEITWHPTGCQVDESVC